VQHGASTLPGEQLAKFPATGATEIHLALGFNNLIFDHPSLPGAIRDRIRDYTFGQHASERAPGETDAQFLYNTRKKAWKVVKKPFWEMPDPAQADIMNVGGTNGLVLEHTTMINVAPPVPEVLRKALVN
jgi:hypothetical protein